MFNSITWQIMNTTHNAKSIATCQINRLSVTSTTTTKHHVNPNNQTKKKQNVSRASPTPFLPPPPKNEEERRIHGLATPLRKFSNISPRPEFRHFKPVYDVSKILQNLVEIIRKALLYSVVTFYTFFFVFLCCYTMLAFICYLKKLNFICIPVYFCLKLFRYDFFVLIQIA